MKKLHVIYLFNSVFSLQESGKINSKKKYTGETTFYATSKLQALSTWMRVICNVIEPDFILLFFQKKTKEIHLSQK